MSGYLWKYYLEDDVDSFRQILENAAYSVRPGAQKSYIGWPGGAAVAPVNSSPGSFGASPGLFSRTKKGIGASGVTLTRSDINSKDNAGLTILHHAASSTSENSVAFAHALLEHPLIDLYVQDLENGWTSLHRALYFGNVSIARMILARDTKDILGHGGRGFSQNARGLVKIKDKEGYGPLDLFSVTIKDRTLRPEAADTYESDSDDEVAHGDSGDHDDESRKKTLRFGISLGADEVFTFGSNKNVTLGFGDQDDRQYPERITLRRPDHLLRRFYQEHREREAHLWSSYNLPLRDSGFLDPKAISDLPTIIRNTPIVIQDVRMSKFHTAVLTADPVSNLYMCGHGPGGRLGTGDESTRYQFTCIESGGLAQKKVAVVALGQNHSLALTDEGEIFSWGNNAFGQLGYTLPRPAIKDDDPISTIPRQIFGPLKREAVIGIAASRIHSVAHTASSLYTFGKNEGQLGIVDSDARSLEMQVTPRRIAAALFSSPISAVSAIDGATTCLLENHEVWVFANYGYAKLNFLGGGFHDSFLKESWLTTKYDTEPNRICKITSGGDTICALSSSGEVFTVAVSKRTDSSQDMNTSTTNPKQIRGALSHPYRIWSSRKGNMAARDVGVDQDGSIILTTEAGSVWRRTKRATLKNASAPGTGDLKPKDYKFTRVSGLTRVIAVRASAYGAYAAIRKDCDVTRTQIGVDPPGLWKALAPLLPFSELSHYEEKSDDEDPAPRFWQRPSDDLALRKRTLKSEDLETEVADIIRRTVQFSGHNYDMEVASTTCEVRIPIHEWIFSGRSRVFREGMGHVRNGLSFELPEVLRVEQQNGRFVVLFQGLDFLSLFNLVLYLYTDSVVDFWNVTRFYPKLAFRYRSVRTELMKVASRLELRQLEAGVRQMVSPRKSLTADMTLAVQDPSYFDGGDVIVELEDGEMRVHSDLISQRCPFFEGLFKGRTGGQWLVGRRTSESDALRVDMKHVETHLFESVVRHMYADTGEELFSEVTSEDLNDHLALEELLDHIMDVMSVANELMIDRLSQICQKTIGRYVHSRNVTQLLNAISPSSVREFKDAALEYICLSLEAVMQNGYLDELDEDLLLELDQVVRDNQLACLPFARSGRAEALLFDKYPELLERIERGRRAKIDAIVLSNKFVEDSGPLPASFRAQSLEELSTSPSHQRTRRRSSRGVKPVVDSPVLMPSMKGKTSVADLMFDMSDGEEVDEPERKIKPPRFSELPTEDSASPGSSVRSPEIPWADVPKVGLSLTTGVGINSPPVTHAAAGPSNSKESRLPGQPWGTLPLGRTKLDLKDIMSQTPSDKPSALSIGFSKQEGLEKPAGSFKVSQKERKKMQQQNQFQTPSKPQPAPPTVSPWQATSQWKATPVATPPAAPIPQPTPPAGTPQLTMRQTIANKGPSAKKKAQQQLEQASQSPGNSSAAQTRPSSSGKGFAISTTPISAPRSIRHIPPPSQQSDSPSQYFTMEDILSQQEAEKAYIRDAAAKRSLQEIQQEQEFQEWWDQESKRVMQEEEQRQRAEERLAKGARGRGRGKRGGGKSKARKEGQDGPTAQTGKESLEAGADTPPAKDVKPPPGQPVGDKSADRGGRGRGRGYRGARGGGRGGRNLGPPREASSSSTPVGTPGQTGAA